MTAPMPDAIDAAAIRADLGEAARALPFLGDPKDAGALLALLRTLYDTGRRDLPLGRLLEGHVDALQIVGRYADPALAATTHARARDGALFGVWNADLPEGRLARDGDGMSGGKSYASGAGVLTHALVTIDEATMDGSDGRQLLLVDLDRAPPAIDRDWWRVVGMQRSQTHIVHWTNAPSDAFAPIGNPGDYVCEPWFSGGALRFVAVHAGGIAALCDHVRDHLIATGRARDPHQAGRLAALFGLADAAALVVRAAADAWFGNDDALRLARVAAARVRVAEAAEQALSIAQAAVGLPGMFHAHPLSAAMTNLAVYIRQPAPDAQRMAVGRAVADGVLVPRL